MPKTAGLRKSGELWPPRFTRLLNLPTAANKSLQTNPSGCPKTVHLELRNTLVAETSEKPLQRYGRSTDTAKNPQIGASVIPKLLPETNEGGPFEGIKWPL